MSHPPQQFGIKLDQLTTGTPGVILYGVTPDDKVIPVKVDSTGILDSRLTVSDIQIGAVEVKDANTGDRLNITSAGEAIVEARLHDGLGLDLTSTTIGAFQALDINRVGGVVVDDDDGLIAPDQTSIDLTLNLLHGFNGTNWERLSSIDNRLQVDSNLQIGNLDVTVGNPAFTDPVDRLARELGRVTSSDFLGVAESFVTGDTPTNARPTNGDFNFRRYRTKLIVVANSGANSARISVQGSVDNGVNFDVVLSTNQLLSPGSTMDVSEQRALTHIRIIARSNAAGNPTTVITKAYALGT